MKVKKPELVVKEEAVIPILLAKPSKGLDTTLYATNKVRDTKFCDSEVGRDTGEVRSTNEVLDTYIVSDTPRYR